MKTTITILVDNIAGTRGTIGEHGFSAWIARGEHQVLFDTGAGNALQMNARCLKKSLDEFQLLLLSHGHWDHTGGLKQVAELRETTEIIAHPRIFDERFSARKRGEELVYHDVGIPFSQEELERQGAHFSLTRKFHEFLPGMYFSGEIPRPPGWQSSDETLCIRRHDQYLPDPILDDASLLLETDSGPVVLLGCAHAGTEIILEYLSAQSGHTSFHAVIGGMHLLHADEERIQTVLDTFEKYQIRKIAATHCTGFPASVKFYQHVQDRFQITQVGDIFDF